MSRLRVYLAGPEVFSTDAETIGRTKQAICAEYGLEGLLPLDNEVIGEKSKETGKKISAANEAMIRNSDLVIANVTPFRGPSADVGTGYEMGFARALGLPVFAYTDDARRFAERTREFLVSSGKFDETTGRDVNGMSLEEFDLFDNVMLAGALADQNEEPTHGTDMMAFRECVQTARKAMENRATALLTQKEFFEKRLEYARYFFDHHAKQRMTMFNFFLVFVGFVVAGYTNVAKDGKHELGAVIALFALVVTVIFLALERRNEELVHITEDVLEKLECDVLFRDFNGRVMWPRRRGLFWMRTRSDGVCSRVLKTLGRLLGWLLRRLCKRDGEGEKRPRSTCSTAGRGRPVLRPLGIFRRQKTDVHGTDDGAFKGDGRSRYEHGRWIPILQYVVLLACLAGMAWGWCWPTRHFCHCKAIDGKTGSSDAKLSCTRSPAGSPAATADAAPQGVPTGTAVPPTESSH